MKVDQQKLNEYLKTLNPHVCPLCGKGPWIIGDTIFYLNEYNENMVAIGGPSFPVLPLVCSTCGYTIFINTIVTGLSSAAPSEDNKGSTNNE